MSLSRGPKRCRKPRGRRRYLAQLLVAGRWVTYRRDRHGRCLSLVRRWQARGRVARLVPADYERRLLREACWLLGRALEGELPRERALALIERGCRG